MEHIFDFESEKNIIGVIDPIPSTNPILAGFRICEIARDRQGKKNILFQLLRSTPPRSTRSTPTRSSSFIVYLYYL